MNDIELSKKRANQVQNQGNVIYIVRSRKAIYGAYVLKNNAEEKAEELRPYMWVTIDIVHVKDVKHMLFEVDKDV